MKRNILALLADAIVACAAVYVDQLPLKAQDQGVAPGGPGGKADWLPAKKTGFGTSYTTASKVWFTLEGGRLSEVYYPRIDTPSVRNLDFVITDGHSFAVRAQDASTSFTRFVSTDQGRREESDDLTNLTYEPGMAVAEGDLVMVHGRYVGWGPKPMIGVDIFRVKDGKVVEHWDVLQEEVLVSNTMSGNAMFTKP